MLNATVTPIPRNVNLVGQRFGRLIVLSEELRDKWNHRRWKCQCDCGQTVIAGQSNLRKGNTQSCGCRAHEIQVANHTTHGLRSHKLYGTWCGMRHRCHCPEDPRYSDYGGRGIIVCPAWEDFGLFVADMGSTYKPGFSIDRIDNNGPYCPFNCRWANQIQQTNNARSNHRLTYYNETHTIAEWSRLLSVPYYVITNRLRMGWTIDRTLNQPVRILHKRHQH